MKRLIKLIKEDLLAYGGKIKKIEEINFIDFFYRYIKTPGFKVTTWMRICNYLNNYTALKVFYFLARLLYRHYQVKYGIQIGFRLPIEGGFCINHYGGVVIAESARIGRNFDIRHNLTVGHVNGKYPIIGDNVSCGAGVIIVGGIHIGDNVLIGAGTVVVKDIPSNSVVVGNSGRVIRKISPTGRIKI